MKRLFLEFPYRQKVLLIVCISVGLLILFCSATNLLSFEIINTVIFFYSFSLPFLFLGFSTILDLNNNKTFIIWLLLSILLLLISFATHDMDKFIIHRSAKFYPSSGINSFMNTHSTSSLKSLFFFLIVYWILNFLLKKSTGNCIVNTFRQVSWYNSEARRRMTGVDVLSNIILVIIIFWSVLF